MDESQHQTIVVNVVLLNFLAQLTVATYIPALPEVSKALNVSVALIQFSAIAYFLGVGMFSLLNGLMSDHYGRKNVILFALLVFAVGTLLCLYSANVYLLIAGRFLLGASINCADNVGRALLADYFNERELVRKYAYFIIAGTVALLIGLAMGGTITHYFGWKKIFLILLIVDLCLMVAAWRSLPTSPAPHVIRVLPKKLTGVAKNIRQILRNKIYWAFMIPIIGASASDLAYNLFLPFLMQDKLGLSPSVYGLIISLAYLGIFLGALLAYLEANYLSIKQLTLQGLLVYLIFTLCLTWIGFQRLLYIPLIVFFAFGFATAAQLIYVNANVGILTPFSKTIIGTVCGLQNTIQTLTVGILNLIFVTVVSGTLFNLGCFMGGILLLALISFFFLTQSVSSQADG